MIIENFSIPDQIISAVVIGIATFFIRMYVKQNKQDTKLSNLELKVANIEGQQTKIDVLAASINQLSSDVRIVMNDIAQIKTLMAKAEHNERDILEQLKQDGKDIAVIKNKLEIIDNH